MSDKTTASWISDKLHGRPVSTPADMSIPRPDGGLAAIKDKLAAGPQAPSNPLSPGYSVDQNANDGNAQSAEEEARGRINDQDVLDAADDPTSELHQLAQRILKAYVQIVELERKKATGQP